MESISSLERILVILISQRSIDLPNGASLATETWLCRVSSGPSPLPQGLRDPPAYQPPHSSRPARPPLAVRAISDEPPPYSASKVFTSPSDENHESPDPPADDVLHFLDPSQDTILSLSLRYGVPQDALRRKNGLFADHLLAARRTILIPGEYCKGGVSLSPEPIESEEEEMRKAKIRRCTYFRPSYILFRAFFRTPRYVLGVFTLQTYSTTHHSQLERQC